MISFLRSWIKNTRGAALIEFAFVFPVMFLLLFGGIEVARYILIVQKVEKSAYALTNIVGTFVPATTSGGAGQLTADTFKTIFPLFDRMMSPYGGDLTQEAVIFTSLVHRTSDSKNMIRWQMGSGVVAGGGTLAVESMVNGASSNTAATVRAPGAPCSSATFTNANVNAQLAGALDQENFIVGEVFFSYHPMIASLLGITGFTITDRVITRHFFIHPRQGDLIDLPPGVPATANPQTDRCPL